MRVLKTMQPGDPGTARFVERFGKNLITVRYRGVENRNMRVTTVELIVDHGFWMPYRRDYLCPDVDSPLKQ